MSPSFKEKKNPQDELDLEQPRAHDRNKSALEKCCPICFNKYDLNQKEVSKTLIIILVKPKKLY